MAAPTDNVVNYMQKKVFYKVILLNNLRSYFLPNKVLCGYKKTKEYPKNDTKKIKINGK